MPEIDPSLLRLLDLPTPPDPTTTSLTTHSTSSFTRIFRLTTPSKTYFVKTSSTPGAHTMFRGEHAGLNAMHDAVPGLCPRSFGTGKLESDVEGQTGWFLVTEFLELGLGKQRGKGKSLAAKLAELHSKPAPAPGVGGNVMFGFEVPTCCGDTEQDNTFESEWGTFFAKRRLQMILATGEEKQGVDSELRGVVDRVVREVVPRLLGKGHLGGERGVVPVVVHGDLWSGNKGLGRFLGRDEDDVSQEVVFDPSVCYAHHEYEHGIMRMFGGFGPGFWNEYHALVPKTEPAHEYEDRVSLYESYHHLNHWAIFGGGYKSGAMGLLKGLLKKYGDK